MSSDVSVCLYGDRPGPLQSMYTWLPNILEDKVTVQVNVYEIPTRPYSLEPVTSTNKVLRFRAVQ